MVFVELCQQLSHDLFLSEELEELLGIGNNFLSFKGHYFCTNWGYVVSIAVSRFAIDYDVRFLG